MIADGEALGKEARVVVVLVLTAFDVNVRLKLLEQLNGRWIGVQVNEIDALERGETGGAEVVWDERPIDAFADVRIAPAPQPARTAAPPATAVAENRAASDAIEIVLGGGRRVRVGRDVNADALRRVLAVLEAGA